MDLLELYLFKISVNKSDYIDYKYDVDQRVLLLEISKLLRPTLLKLKYENMSKSKIETSKINKIIDSSYIEILKNISALSVPAGFIMIMGVLLFKIEFTQAFLTWFTVSFGAAAISIKSKKIQKNTNNS